jgi:hypothetical protein
MFLPQSLVITRRIPSENNAYTGCFMSNSNILGGGSMDYSE